MIRRILVPVRGDGKGDNVFAHAAVLARRFGAHIKVIHCRPRPEDLVPYGVPVPAFMGDEIKARALEIADLEEKGLRRELELLAAALEIPITDSPLAAAPSASWVEESGRQVDVIKRHGRLADLIVVAKPERDRNLGTNTLKAALFNTGRPVMMCPPRAIPPEVLGDNITIAWNGSTEAARAIALTADLLEKASTITILSAGDSEVHGAGADDLLEYLALRGVSALVERFAATRKIGEELLARSAAVGADMMIMGAYSDSHEREIVFGGNTQAVIDSAEMPVVLVH